MIDLSKLPKNRHLYEIHSHDWLDIYPNHCEPLERRLKMLFEELWHNSQYETVDTSNWTFKDVPYSNGYKTILSIWFLLQEKSLKDPITINYFDPGHTPPVLMEPGALRTQMLPYLPNHKIQLITFNIDNYLPVKYEKSFNEVSREDLEARSFPINSMPDKHFVGIYKMQDRKDYAYKCRKHKVQITYNEKGLAVNNKLLIKFKNGKYLFTQPKLYKPKGD